MSASDPKPVSVNGWIAAFILIIVAYSAYYGSVFPKLNEQDQDMFYRKVNTQADNNANFYMEIKIPKNFSEFQESTMTLNMACVSSNGCRGSLLLVSFMIDERAVEIIQQHVTLRRLDLQDAPRVSRNLSVEYDLKTNDVLSIPVSVLLPSRNGEEAAFSVYIDDESKEEAPEVEKNPEPVTWDTPTCQHENSSRICASIAYSQTLKQSAVENLLFPPWSNRILPFVAFAMVWLAEQVLPNKEAWNTYPNKYAIVITLIGCWFLFLLYAVLYFALLTDQWLISALFALFFVLCILTLPKFLSGGGK